VCPVSFADRIKSSHRLGIQLTTDSVRVLSASNRLHTITRALLCGVCALGLGVALAMDATPAAAKAKLNLKSGHNETARAAKEPFGEVPKGPVQIFVSISQQKLYVYSDGNLVADSLVATGVPSLPTPTGVFSVIQKQVFHRSNIYSNAPMPFMQRITWSGVAMHEGENIGHPASHGCIRMPHEFAARLYNFTALGARVIVARNELKPAEFADSRLFVHKDIPVGPAAAAAAPTKTAQSVDASKATDAGAPLAASAAVVPPSNPAGVDKQADANNGLAAAAADPVGAPAAQSTITSEPVSADAAASQAPEAEATTTFDPTPSAFSPPSPLEPAKPVVAAPSQANLLRGSESAPAATDAGPEQVTPVPPPKPAALVEASAASHAPIAIFISRRTKKIYVRQHFAPLFDAPITIENPEKPFGTHVFTAMGYLTDGSTFRWNVVSFPGETLKAVRAVARGGQYEKHAERNRRQEDGERAVVDSQPSQTPGEALARIEIPQDVIDQISAMMVPGSSLVVSDEGLGPETGEGTDFIVVTH
jgi:L,D-transpeptidase catalytic domain